VRAHGREPLSQSVSVIVPARNEASHIRACIRSILEQEFPGELEVIVADGDSEDSTRLLADQEGARVVANPARTIPAGLNRALAEASGEIVVRFDAHAEMPPGYLAACLAGLQRAGVANVGGWRKAEGRGPWGRAIAVALASPAGVGNSRIWRRPSDDQQPVEVETVPLGAWQARTLRDAGGWREDILANEDFELNHRLRLGGGKVMFDPAIWSIYRPRETIRSLAVQYRRYGWWKAVVLRENPGSLRPRQLAPLVLTAVVAASPASRYARRGLLVYAGGMAAVTVRSRGGWRVLPTLATMHVAWGVGLLGGLMAGAVRPSRR
jgi:succinoglycan biosynthesis protein ExoA